MPESEGESPPLFCCMCDRRAAQPAAGPPICLKCIHDGAKRNPLVFSEFPTDPYLRQCVYQLYGAS